MGKEICRLFLLHNVHVIASVRDLRSLQTMNQFLEEKGFEDKRDFTVLPMDVTRIKSISAAATAIADNYPQVNVSRTRAHTRGMHEWIVGE